MNETVKVSCAPPNAPSAWDQINWKQCQQSVSRLQARIVKATQDGKWGKVKALQHLLTHSFSAKALAVKQVTENRGKNTPGVDRVLWSTEKSRFGAIFTLKQRGYRPRPLRRIYIPKAGSKKLRPLSIPTMKDRAMQTLYKFALEPIAETLGDQNSYGFRIARSTHDAMRQCFNCLANVNSSQWILEGDIAGAFDNVSHEWIMENIPMDKGILYKFMRSGYIDAGRLFPTDQGTGQGSSISPVIFNMVLDGLETEINRKAKEIKRRDHSNPKINFCRYADDFIVTGSSREILDQEIKPLVEDFLSNRGLHLSEEKTITTHIDQGFDFLGWNVRKYKGKVLIKPAKKKTIAFLNRIRSVIKGNKAAAQESLIRLLNPMTRGWAQYHNKCCAKEAFSWVDHQIWKCLWQWSKRKHSQKSKKWVKNRYFHRVGRRDWVFGCNGLELLSAASTKIQRHVKIKAALNPFDPKWRDYLDARKKEKNKFVTVCDYSDLFG